MSVHRENGAYGRAAHELTRDQAADRHPATKCDVINAHHTATHFIRRDQLNQRTDHCEYGDERGAGSEQQDAAERQRA